MISKHATKGYYSYILFMLSCLLLSYSSTKIHVIGIEPRNTNNNTKCINKEKKALLELKEGIEIDRCNLLTSWGNRKDCCKWQGVRCNQYTGNVIELDLHGFNRGYPCLKGKLGPSLVKLEHLVYLDLSHNNFRGQSIPRFLGSLSKLKHLNLSNSGFLGEIPHQLGNLSNLESFHLSCISLSLYCQYAVNLQWLSNLTSLKCIDFINIDLSSAIDWVQVINKLPSLTFVRMNKCGLNPSFSTSSSPNPNLHFLDLGNNNLNSSIYQWLFNSSGLEMINLGQNQLEGPIPDELGNLSSLRYLDFSGNRIGCPIPDTIGDLRNLAHLRLSENKLQGCTLPKTFGDLCNLRSLFLDKVGITEELSSFIQRLCVQNSLLVLDLSGNQIWGSIPEISDIFPSLKELYVDNNRLNGTISESLGQLSKLERLSISSNSVKDILSDKHLRNLSRLNYLDLSNNSLLVFNFSTKWVPPFQADTIRLRSCKLGPDFPKWVLSQRKFSYLDISDAGISETIPISFWNLLTSKLSYLNMSHNMIPGTIPNLSITFDQLSPPDIDLSSNYFEGSIPYFLGNVSKLSLSYNMFSDAIPLLCPKSRVILFDLDLSNNLISGELPGDCWVHNHMDQLSFLNLESNNFSGKLPTSLGTLKKLQSFRACDNRFSGGLPLSLQNCTSLVILDIGDNIFSGYIPPVGDILPNLVVLNLRKNKFLGKIPLSLCKLSDLQILDLSGNGISGKIPECIYNFTAMTNQTDFLTNSSSSSQGRLRYPYAAWIGWKRVQQKFGDLLGLVKSINISNNKLDGEIPTGITFLAGLVSLDLSKNQLSGIITPKIGQLISLQFLDLSNNHFYGEIPISLANLSFLAILDLSNNNLSGKIPLGTQLQSFDATTYKGNPELCGAPLPNKCSVEQGVSKRPNREKFTQQHEDKNDIFPGLYISVTLGFIVGFWGVCGPLWLKKPWRDAFFRFLFDTKDRLYETVAMNRVWRSHD